MVSIKLKNILLISFGVSLLFEHANFHIFVSVPPKSCFSDENFVDAQIFLTQSANINNILKRQINVYWHNIAFQKGDIIALFNGQPNNYSKPLWQFEPTTNKGSIGTNLYISLVHKYKLTSYKEEILVFCGAWLRNDKITKGNCLSTHPTWMHDRKMILKNQKLSNLIIPATYISGMYIQNLPSQESVAEKFTVTQNQDILTQLVHGARYLDIPVGHYPDLNQKYWAIYDNKKVMPLERIIRDIIFFMNGTKEIVMLAFRAFSVGFHGDTDHEDFVKYLKKTFSNHLLMKQNPDDEWSITTGKIWALDKRLIIVYESYYQEKDTFLWSSPWITNMFTHHDLNNFRHYVLTSEEIIQHLFNLKENLNRELLRIIYLTVSVKINMTQIEATCNKTCIDNHPSNSRRLGDKVAPIITSLYNEKLYQYTNIVAAKFLDATGLVDIAILWNERRALNCIKFFTTWNNKFLGKFTRTTMYFG